MAEFKSVRELRDQVAFRINGYEGAINKFKERLNTNPVYAFQWAESAMDAAAKQEVAVRLISAIDSFLEKLNSYDAGQTPEETEDEFLIRVTKYYNNEALRLAERVSSSTSSSSNQMENYERAATVKLYRFLNGDFLSGF